MDYTGQRVWLTSDQHFSHKNIIEYCNRPFKDIHHMNEVLIFNYNSLVSPGDIVFNLGDVCMGQIENIDEYIPRLNGNIIHIIGNHDRGRRLDKIAKYWPEQYDKLMIEYKGIKFKLIHNKEDRIGTPDFIYLYGHVHDDAPKGLDTETWSYHIGVDTNDYKPVSLEQIYQEVAAAKLNN